MNTPTPLRLTCLRGLNTRRFLGRLLLCAALFSTIRAGAQTNGTWNVDASGNWSDTNNWFNGLVANGVGSTANLTYDISGAATVSIDTAVTVGALNIGDASTNYTLALAGGALAFDNSGSGATISKTAGSVAQTITAGFSVLDNLTISNGTSSSLTLSGSISNGISGAKTITKTGSGAVILGASNAAFTGNFIVAAGSLQAGAAGSLGSNNAVRLDSGAALRVNSSVTIAGLTDNGGAGGSVANSSGGGKILTVAGSGAYSFGGSFTGSNSATKVGLAVLGSGTQSLVGNNTTNIGYQSVTGGATLVYAKQDAIFQGLGAGAVTNGNASASAGIYVGSGSTVALRVGDAASGYFDSSAIVTFLDATHMGLSTTSAGFASSSIFGLDTSASGGSFTYSNALANVGTSTGNGFAKLGSGTLILSQNSTYTGVTQVREGTLQVGAGGSTGSISSGTATVSGGANLAFNRSDSALTAASKITGAGSVSKSGSGTVTLSATNSDYSGGTTLTGGRLTVKTLGSGTVTIGGSATQLNLNSSSTYSNAISISGGTGIGSQGLVDTGTGLSVVLSGPVAISGAPTNGGHFGSSSTGALTISGPITSSVPVVFRRGTGILSGGGTGYTALQVRADTLKLGASNGIATTATVSLGGDGAATLDLSGYSQSLVGMAKGNNPATILNNGAADVTLATTGTSTYAGTIQDGTSKVALAVNGGSLTLSGTNSYTGATTIAAGALAVTNGSAIPDTGTVTLANAAGATFVVRSSETIASLQGGGTNGGDVTISAFQTLAVAENGDSTFSGRITDAGGLAKSGTGTMTLAGANTHTGSTTIEAGTLKLGPTGSMRFVIGPSGQNNSVSGAGAFVADGTFEIDLSSAGTNSGGFWQLVSVAPASFGALFSVSGFTQASADTWSVATNGVTYVFSETTGELSVAGGNPYNTWAAGYGLDPATNGAPAADPDGDSLANFTEYAFGTSPTAGNAALVKAVPSGGQCVITWLQRQDYPAGYTVQETSDLLAGPWQTSSAVVQAGSGATPPAGYEWKQISVPTSAKKFYRVTASF